MPCESDLLRMSSAQSAGKKGAAVWEENEDPVYQRGDWGTTLTRVSEGFRAAPGGRIFCAVCDIEAGVGQKPAGSLF